MIADVRHSAPFRRSAARGRAYPTGHEGIERMMVSGEGSTFPVTPGSAPFGITVCPDDA